MYALTLVGIIAQLNLLNLEAIEGETKSNNNIPNIIVGRLESKSNNHLREGLLTPISPQSAITSAHLIAESESIEVIINGEKRYAKQADYINRNDSEPKIDELYSDLCIISWDNPLHLEKNHYPTISNIPPSPDENIWIAKQEGDKIVWERRYIVGVEGYAAWSNLPRKLYSVLLYLNGRPSNRGTPFEAGDSGGPWINSNGNIVAVTSRVVNKKMGPSHQVVYGTLTQKEPSPKKSGGKQSPITLPLTVSIFTILILLWAFNKKRTCVHNKIK